MTINKLETCENPSIRIVSDLPDNKIIIGADNISDTLYILHSPAIEQIEGMFIVGNQSVAWTKQAC